MKTIAFKATITVKTDGTLHGSISLGDGHYVRAKARTEVFLAHNLREILREKHDFQKTTISFTRKQ